MPERTRWRRTRAVLALAHLARDARRPLTLSVVLALAAGVVELVPLYVVYLAALDLIEGTATIADFGEFALVAGAAVLGYNVLFAASSGISHVAAFEVMFSIRVRIADRLARLPLGYFSRRRSGALKKLIVDDVDRLELFIAHGIPEMIAGLGVWLGATAWLFTVDWRMAIAATAVVPISFLLMHVAMRRIEPTVPAAQEAEVQMNGSIVEYVGGMPVIRMFNRADDAFRETREAVAERTRTWELWSRAFIPLGSPFSSLVVSNIVVIVPTGLWLYLTGHVDASTVVFFVILGIGYSARLLKFFNQGRELAYMASSGELVELMLTEPELPDSRQPADLVDHSIEFRDVCFSYGDREVITDASFTAAQGEVTALVGPSGAGKSTIARLIARFWDVERGAIFLGGIDVRDIAVERLVREVAVVFQDTFLFDDTIEANISIGRTDATIHDVQAAARAAGCHDFVAGLREGYQTMVGERGARLSGGERQRIAIARAILKDSPVVLLDEATAFADPESEADIQDAISTLVAGRTLIVVAHRLSTVAGANQIVVVDGGQIIDRGTHNDLLGRCELYGRMWHDHLEARRLSLKDALPTDASATA